MKRVSAWAIGILAAVSVGAEEGGFTDIELQVRSNILDGFNLPANSSFNSKTPSLNDAGQVAVALSVVGGDTTVQGLWLGGGGVGSVVWTDDRDGFVSDCSVNDSGDIVVELYDGAVSPEGLYLYDFDLGGRWVLDEPAPGGDGMGFPDPQPVG